MSVGYSDIECTGCTELHVVTGRIDSGEYDGESCGDNGIYLNGSYGTGLYVNSNGTVGRKCYTNHSSINEFADIMFGIECNIECEWGIGK